MNQNSYLPQADHNRQKKIAVINDFTGFGRCSLAVSIPVISKLRVQCCPVPTAILSNHTGFPSFHIDDYTRHLTAYMEEWKKLDLRFAGIETGYIGSPQQFAIVEKFIEDFATADTIVIVDPVLGDYGKVYAGYTGEMCERMKGLAARADILTPNLTEACFLTNTPYHDGHWSLRELETIIRKLSKLAQTQCQETIERRPDEMSQNQNAELQKGDREAPGKDSRLLRPDGSPGPGRIVITGIPQGEFIANLSYRRGYDFKLSRQYRVGEQRSGTGDVFSAIIAADAVNGVEFDRSVRRASAFVKRCILRSIEMGIPTTDGVAFEEVLDSLRAEGDLE